MDSSACFGKVISEQESGRYDRALRDTTVERVWGRTVTVCYSSDRSVREKTGGKGTARRIKTTGGYSGKQRFVPDLIKGF